MGLPSRSLMPPLTSHPCAEPFENANKWPTSLVAGVRGEALWRQLVMSASAGDLKNKYSGLLTITSASLCRRPGTKVEWEGGREDG